MVARKHQTCGDGQDGQRERRHHAQYTRERAQGQQKEQDDRAKPEQRPLHDLRQIARIELVGFAFQVQNHCPSRRGQRYDRPHGLDVDVDVGILRGGARTERQKRVPSAVSSNQHRVVTRSERGARQVRAGDGRAGPRDLQIIHERGETLCAHGQGGDGLPQTGFQVLLVGNGSQACFLGRETRQVARRTLEAADDTSLHESGEPVTYTLRIFQHGFLVGPGDHHEVAHVRGTYVGPQLRVEILIGQGHRAECG